MLYFFVFLVFSRLTRTDRIPWVIKSIGQEIEEWKKARDLEEPGTRNSLCHPLLSILLWATFVNKDSERRELRKGQSHLYYVPSKLRLWEFLLHKLKVAERISAAACTELLSFSFFGIYFSSKLQGWSLESMSATQIWKNFSMFTLLLTFALT